MEIEIREQLSALVLSLLMGAGMALVYDMIRPFRYRLSRFSAALSDVFFCLVVFFLAFCFGMKAGNGRLGIWELCGMALGFTGYVYFISDSFFRIFDMWLTLFEQWADTLIKLIKKAIFYIKLYFKKLIKCFIIKK